jgi:hypothetical protein
MSNLVISNCVLSESDFDFQLLQSRSVSLMSIGGGIGIPRGDAVAMNEKDQKDQNHDQGKCKQGEVPARFGPFCGEQCHLICKMPSKSKRATDQKGNYLCLSLQPLQNQ